MRLVIFGLTVSSSWGNGHATLWRGLCRALHAAGHEVVFFERDAPYYATSRDQPEPQGCDLRLYGCFDEVRASAERAVARADAAMVTSYCPDGIAAAELVLGSGVPVRTFYDLDTPVTLERLRIGRPVAYLDPARLREFDLVLSYTGGAAVESLRTRFGAKRVATLYGSVDPSLHRPLSPPRSRPFDLSYLGTFAEDRRAAVDRLLFEPARRLPARRFVLGGAQYGGRERWPDNVAHCAHVAPPEHAAFYGAAARTLNVTRAAMAAMGYCPSGRLFEAAACGVAILTDVWEGLGHFFEPGREVIPVETTADVLEALDIPEGDLARIAAAGRARALAEHTAEKRARELVELLRGGTPSGPAAPERS